MARNVIEKITLNLLSNALKFTPDHGSIEVQLHVQDVQLELTVRDTGVGIDNSHIKHIFERFYQVDSINSSGTGIGLALVKQFVTLLGGTISVSSEIGKGTLFTVLIPLNTNPKLTIKPYEKIPHITSADAPTELWLLAQTTSEPASAVHIHKNVKKYSKKPLILIADDSADMRAFMQALLEDRFDIILAENGKEAIEMIDKHEPQVILTDAMMPYMDGYQLTKAVKANNKTRHIPVILVTAKTGNESIISGLDVGANDYLSKPFLPEELIARIQASLRTYYDYIALTQANLKLEQEIEERKKLEFKNNELTGQLVLAARQAGMADIATSVLHNIGNVLNSANISTAMITHRITHSRISDLEKITALLHENKDNIGNYLTKDKTGKHIIQYLGLLTKTWKEDYNSLISETRLLKDNIEHIRNIIMQQQALGRTIGFNEKTSIPELIEHCISLNNINNKMIEIIREYAPIKEVTLDKVKLMQVMVNLIKNSMDSLQESNVKKKQITVRTYEKDESSFIIQVGDNGIGIAPEHLEKIFSHGFTTKKAGHGYGLHASAVSIQEMNGALTVESKGVEMGAVFTLTLSYNPLKGESHGTKANSCSG